ncbi:MAG: MATE family efflux transporter, partial [bacterium]
MLTMARCVVGGLVSLAAVAYYTVPQEIALRLLLIPAALAGTLFPMLAQAHGAGSAERVNRLLARGVLATLAIGLPMCVVFAAFAEPALALWMGPTFAQQSAPAAAVFASGLLANSVAQVPFATLQSAGRSDLPARLHLVELPLFLALLYMLTSLGGLLGAACAWTVR